MYDAYELVTIRAGVLVPESHHVSQFVDDHAKLVAVLADRHGLGTVPFPPDKRTAAGNKKISRK